MDKLTRNITMKKKIIFTNKEKKENFIKINISIDANHVFEQHSIDDLATYIQNLQINQYNKEKSIDKNKRK